jgi:hypothetical protein
MVRIARSASSTVARSRMTNRCGSSVWSIAWTVVPSAPSQMVR